MNKTQIKNRCRIILDKYPYKTKIEDKRKDITNAVQFNK